MKKKAQSRGRGIRNKKARFEYIVLETLETGIVLQGTEVKSLRAGAANLDDAFARIENDELYLCSCQIDPYSHGNQQNHDPKRRRKLLAHGREIKKLTSKVVQRGQTLVPLRIYFNDRGRAKVELALVRGKSHADRRQDLKARAQKREMDRALRRG